MAELLLTSSIDPIEEGQVFEHGLPRHVTIWQDFTLPDLHMEAFIHDVSFTSQAFSPFEILGTEPAEFGPNNDVPVRRIMAVGRAATLTSLHTVLGSVIHRHGGEEKNPEWAYEGFNPHITYVDGRALEKAEYAKLSTIELIQRDPKNTKRKIVRKIWELEDAYEEEAE